MYINWIYYTVFGVVDSCNTCIDLLAQLTLNCACFITVYTGSLFAITRLCRLRTFFKANDLGKQFPFKGVLMAENMQPGLHLAYI